jgi:hypothetical protein
MSLSGDRVRRLTAPLFSERNRRRLIEPAIADLQAEFVAAQRAGSGWRTLRALVAGYLSVAKVLVIAACSDLRHEGFAWQPEERAGVWQGVRVAAAVTTATTVLSIVSIVASISTSFAMPGWHPWLAYLRVRMWLGLYLLPATLALTVPLGLTLGTAWALRGAARTGKLGAAAAVVAAVCSLGMFVNIAWLTPHAHQTFRQIAISRFFHWDEDRPLARGDYEFTFSALRERFAAARQFGLPRTPRFFETLYYRELAQTVAALPMVGVVLALAYRRRWGGAGVVVASVLVIALHYAGLRSSPYTNAIFGAPPIVAAWLPNGMLAAAAMLLAAAPTSPRYAR